MKLLSKVNTEFNQSKMEYYEFSSNNQKKRIKKNNIDKNNKLQRYFCIYSGSASIPYSEGVELGIKPSYIFSKIHFLCSYISKLYLHGYKNFDSKDDFSYNLYSFNLFDFLKTVSTKDLVLLEFIKEKTVYNAITKYGVNPLMEKIISFLQRSSHEKANDFLKKVKDLKSENDKIEFSSNAFEFIKTISNQKINFFQLLYKTNICTALKLFKPSILIGSIKSYLNKDNSLVAKRWKEQIDNLNCEEDKIKFIKDIFQKYKDLSVLYTLLKIQNNDPQIIKFDSYDLVKIEEDLLAKKYDLITLFNDYLKVPNLYQIFRNSNENQKIIFNNLNFYYSAYKMFQNNTNLLANIVNLDEDKKNLLNCFRFGNTKTDYRIGKYELPLILKRKLPINKFYNSLIYKKERLKIFKERELKRKFKSLFQKHDKKKSLGVKKDILCFNIEEFIFNFLDRGNTFEKDRKI